MSAKNEGPRDERELLVQLLIEQRTTNDLLRVLAIPTLKTTLETLLGKEIERKAYEATNGTRTTRAIGELVGTSQPTISRWWTAWRNAGVAVDVPGGHVRHLMPLSALGIKIEASHER